jgi:hypothetical protein
MLGVIFPTPSDGIDAIGRLTKYITNGHKLTNSYDEVKGVWYYNIAGESPDDAYNEMLFTASRNSRAFSPMMHIMISWPAGEYPEPFQVQDIAISLLSALKLDENQAVYALHKNTDNYHLHLAVNRVKYDAKKNKFVTVDPGGGFKILTMQRTLRELELKHGFEVCHNGAIDIIDNQIVRNRHSVISPKARRFESFQGDISETTRLKNVFNQLLEASKSWSDFHKRLSEYGVTVKAKGSGGVAMIGDETIKLSAIGRNFTWARLIEKLGRFEPGPAPAARPSSVEFQKPKPVIRTISWQKYSELRQEYLVERRAYIKARAEVWSQLEARQRDEWQNMVERHRVARELLNRQKMRGIEKNAARKKLAFDHVKELAPLKARHNEERLIFKEQWPYILQKGGSFPAFKSFLELSENEKEKWIFKYRRYYTFIKPANYKKSDDLNEEDENDYFSEKNIKKRLIQSEQYILAIFNFSHHTRGSDIFYYDDKNNLAFIDYGNYISILSINESHVDENAILSCLHLCLKKWGKIEVEGTDFAIKSIFEVAFKNGIKLENKEFSEFKALKLDNPPVTEKLQTKKLKEVINEINTSQNNLSLKISGDQDMSSENLRTNLEQYIKAVDADQYRVTMIKFLPDGKKRTWIFHDKDSDEAKLLTPAQLLANTNQIFNYASKQNYNIYLTPISNNKRHILIDDLSIDSLKKFIEQDGYKPSVLIESSPNNYQAILNIDVTGSKVDPAAANRLIEKLNCEYGDSKLRGSVHPHRMPGTWNFKKFHETPDGFPPVRLRRSANRRCDRATAEFGKLVRDLEAVEEARQVKAHHFGSSGASPFQAYSVHARDLMNFFDKLDYSRLDAMVAVRMRCTGHSEAAIEEAIKTGSPLIRPAEHAHKHNWAQYAARTAAFAFSPAGDLQVEKARRSLDIWMKMENSDQEKSNRTKMR